MIGAFALWSWQQTQTEVATSLRGVAQFVSDNAQDTFDELSKDLPYLGLKLRNKPSNLSSKYTLLRNYQDFHPNVASMALFLPNGRMLLNTAVPFDTQLPGLHKKIAILTGLENILKSHTLSVGQTQIGPILHDWRIPLRFVVRNFNGNPLFILQASVRLTHITSEWARLSLPQTTALGLLRFDGYKIASLSGTHSKINYDSQVRDALFQTLHRYPNRMIGTYLGKTQTNGSYRLGAYVYVPGYPIVAYASLSNHEIISGWAHQVIPFVALGLASIFSFVGFAYLLINREQRRPNEPPIQLKNQALTSLPNRRGVQEWIKTQINRGAITLTVMQIDIENFKDINATMGTDAGDHVLQEIARRLQIRVDHLNGFIAHLDADEFLIAIPGSGLIKAHATAQSIRHIINSPLEIEGHTLHLQSRIGIASISETKKRKAINLLRALDLAIHDAKSGSAGVTFYDPTTGSMNDANVNFHHAIEYALEHDEFNLYYQPIISLKSGKVVGAEGLLRWEDRKQGLLLPNEFISIAEITGWIGPLGEWVFRRAIKDIRYWKEMGLDIYISINLSASQFKNHALLRYLKEELGSAGGSSERIVLEITESTAMQDVGQSSEIMDKITRLGFQFAIDDFGANKSSLSCLSKLPAQTIKIHRKYTSRLETSQESVEIIKTIVGLTKALGKKSLAQGIENKKQYTRLNEIGVDMGQGYLFCRPLSARDFVEKIKNNNKLI